MIKGLLQTPRNIWRRRKEWDGDPSNWKTVPTGHDWRQRSPS